MSRGNRRSMIVDNDDDRRMFMDMFGEAAVDYGVRVYACCLMGTHYHALLETPRVNLSDFIRGVNCRYSRQFNRRHGRVGHTFEQRFKSHVVQREKYLRRVARYIALNPVKAELCADPAAWPWSTHRATAGQEEAPPWLHLDWLRWAFRADCVADAQRCYETYTRDPSGLTWSFDMARTLGTPRFQKAANESWQRYMGNRPLPIQARKSVAPPLAHMFSGNAGRGFDRDALILVAHFTHGYRLAEIARFLGVKPSTVSKALSRARVSTALVGPDGHELALSTSR